MLDICTYLPIIYSYSYVAVCNVQKENIHEATYVQTYHYISYRLSHRGILTQTDPGRAVIVMYRDLFKPNQNKTKQNKKKERKKEKREKSKGKGNFSSLFFHIQIGLSYVTS